ncbi:TPA: hypothetical protein DCX15_01425 [bacterium]|nr:hypothetical protein [bacterium]
MEEIHFLRKVPLFIDFTYPELEKIGPLFKDEFCNEAEILLKRDEPEKGLYIIESGLMAGIREVKTGEEKVVVDFDARDCFGEMALIHEDQICNMTIKAVRPTKLIYLSRDEFKALCRDEVELGFKFLTAIAGIVERRLQASYDEITNLAIWGKEMRGILTKFREVIDEGEEIRIVLAENRQILGRIEAYERGIGGVELLFRDTTGHLFVIPYHAVQYFIIQHPTS